MNRTIYIGAFVPAILAIGIIAPDNAFSQAAGGGKDNGMITATDCTEIDLSYDANPSLTKEEQVELMDKELFQSLSKFEACIDAVSRNADSSNSSSGGGGGGAGSMASSGISGTEQSAEDAASEQSSEGGNQSEYGYASNSGSPDSENAALDGSGDMNNASLDNGKIPDDIPPANNDGVLEAQIRQAAMNEPDPAVREKLWDEYRKYKGIKKSN